MPAIYPLENCTFLKQTPWAFFGNIRSTSRIKKGQDDGTMHAVEFNLMAFSLPHATQPRATFRRHMWLRSELLISYKPAEIVGASCELGEGGEPVRYVP